MTADEDSRARPLRGGVRLAACLLALLVLASGAAAREADDLAQAAGDLEKEYDRLTQYSDFASFSKRMGVIRSLGKLDTPEATTKLLRIVRSSKRIDDEVVAIIALGPRLDLDDAKELAGLVARRGGPVRVHALGMSFSQVADPEVLTWLSGDALRVKSEDVLRAALDAQYLHADERAVDCLKEIFKEHSARERGAGLAYAAVRALGAVNGPKVRTFLLRAVGHQDFRVRLAAAEVMPAQEPMDVNVRGALRALLKDDPVIRQAAAEAIGKAGTAELQELIPDLADRLEDEHIKTRDVAHRALTRLTHKDFGFDPAHWKGWWKNRSENQGPLKATPSTSVTTYYGVNVHSDRMLFIVDLSGSMAFPWGQDTTRIDVAREELAKVLARLDPDTLFNIIVFSDKVKSWRKGAVLAKPDAVARALKWMDKVFKEPRGGTFMHAALEKAFLENPRVDTIFLLTDGLATDGEPIVPEAILASVGAWNRYRRVVIHTFALTLEDLDKKGMNEANLAQIKSFMKQLARLTDGESMVVSDLPKGFVKKDAPKRNGKNGNNGKK